MSRMTTWFLLLIGYVVFEAVVGNPATAMLGENELPPMTASMEIEGKPVRPRLFQSPEQIRMYLDTLGKYYTSHNRNRFGKRMAERPIENSYREQFDKGFQDYDVGNTL